MGQLHGRGRLARRALSPHAAFFVRASRCPHLLHARRTGEVMNGSVSLW